MYGEQVNAIALDDLVDIRANQCDAMTKNAHVIYYRFVLSSVGASAMRKRRDGGIRRSGGGVVFYRLPAPGGAPVILYVAALR